MSFPSIPAFRHTVCALLALCLVSCASGGGGGPSEAPPSGSDEGAVSSARQGGLWGQIARDLESRAARDRVAGARRAAIQRGGEDLDPALKARIDRWWATYTRRPWEIDSRLDPRRGQRPDAERLLAARKQIQKEWLEARTAWEEAGPGPRNILVENLIRWYVLAYDAGDGYEVERTRKEILRHQDLATPYLVYGLASGDGDDVVNARVADLLAWFGPEVLPVIEEAFDAAEPKRGRWALARALKRLRSEEAVPLLMRLARDRSEDYRVRIEALEGLGKLAAKEALPVYIQCLKDADPSVRKFSAAWCAALGEADPELLNTLISTLEDALGRDPDLARECVQALQILTKRRIGMNPGAWRRAVEEETAR